MKSLQNFDDYRLFLRWTYSQLAAGQKTLSLDRFSTKLGLHPSTLKMILLGKRNLTTRCALKISQGLKFSFCETEYFESLVLFNQARDLHEKTYYRKRLKNLKNHLRLQNVKINKKVFLSEPFMPGLLTYLSETVRPGDDLKSLPYEKIAKLFGQPQSKIKRLIEVLEKEILPHGGSPEDAAKSPMHLNFDKLTHVNAQKEYLKKTFSQASSRIEEEYEKPNTYFTAFTFTTSTESLQALQLDLKELMDKHLGLVPAVDPQVRMAQACFQVFPLSHDEF